MSSSLLVIRARGTRTGFAAIWLRESRVRSAQSSSPIVRKVGKKLSQREGMVKYFLITLVLTESSYQNRFFHRPCIQQALFIREDLVVLASRIFIIGPAIEHS